MSDVQFKIRPAESKDENAVYEVCLRTGNAGQDATHLYTDPKALGHLFVGPYLHLEPELAFVLEAADGVCGYVLGALDSSRFYRAYLDQWLPELRRIYAHPTGDPGRWTATEKLYYEYHHPNIFFPENFKDVPSHLHIDLFPRAQRRGQGTRMIGVLLERLTMAGSPGVHLALSSANCGAERFYRKLGFVELARAGASDRHTLYLGKRLGEGEGVAH